LVLLVDNQGNASSWGSADWPLWRHWQAGDLDYPLILRQLVLAVNALILLAATCVGRKLGSIWEFWKTDFAGC
jgi:hypothetical protein